LKGICLAATVSPPQVELNQTWFHRWIFYLASGFMFAAALLRSVLILQNSSLLGTVLILSGAWLLVFIGSLLLAGRSRWVPAILISLEILLIQALLLTTQQDFFAFLFAIPSMQVRQQYTMKSAVLLTGFTTIMTLLSLYQKFGIFYSLAIAVVFFSGSMFLLIFIGSTRRLRLIQDQQQELVMELQQANRQLEFYSQQVQQLTSGRERQHLARELHDSVTQTIFSMTLTTQSALLLLEHDRNQVAAQLDRLNLLAHNALAEMQRLISRLAPEEAGGFVPTLREHVAERRRLEALSVDLEVQGNQPLNAMEEQSLFRIVQEALNNVVKHAGVRQATVRLHLEEQPWLEIADEGIGFEAGQTTAAGKMGLSNMQERAAGIGWSLQVKSSPGTGTRVLVWKDSGGEKPK
jgi:signal transduction histidine kinase